MADIMQIGKVVAYLAFVLVIAELLLEWLVDRLRERFQWLITKKRDYLPQIDPAGLTKFIADGFDPELGWVRKPDTEHSETGRFGKTCWHTNGIGARLNPGHEDLPVRIACFGDSFTFCRQVNDNETWEYRLSELTGTNVLNWGVGNHGIDQSLLRMRREYPKQPAEIVIVGVVPDTISRILSVWKHFYEYGNTFGFKPRFINGSNGLQLIANRIDSEKEYYNLFAHLNDLRELDYFYEKKFTQEIISFPYLYSVFRNSQRNIPLIYWNIMALISSNPETYYALGRQKIMDINLDWRVKLYQDPATVDLLTGIVMKMHEYAGENGFKLILGLLPQKDDVLHVREYGHFYQILIDRLAGKVATVDLMSSLLKIDSLDEYYSDDSIYGGHFSKLGNELVAQKLLDVLQRNNNINRKG